MRFKKHTKSVLLTITFFVLAIQLLLAQTNLPMIEFVKPLTGTGLVVNATATVENDRFFDPTASANIDVPYPIQNIVTLKINEGYTGYLANSFTATVQLNIRYTNTDLVDSAITRTFVVKYDSASAYKGQDILAFNGAQRVIVKVLNIQVVTTGGQNVTSTNLPYLIVENKMQVQPRYKFNCTTVVPAVFATDSSRVHPDELYVSWGAVFGAYEYDVEWTYVDSSVYKRVYNGAINTTAIFDNNVTRVSLQNTSYAIPLLYSDTGYLCFRIRPVQYSGAQRFEGAWSQVSSTQNKGIYAFGGHERRLNWQSTISYAEDGKRKVVLQYYDGSLRSRQTVSKDNTTNKTIIAESLYDFQGRPVIQVLPVPTLNSIIGYTRKFNVGMNGNEYEKTRYDTLQDPTAYCSVAAEAMDTSSGASKYYSASNPDKTGLNSYIPDAGGYPFTETQYTQDGTGRIKKQSGVGANYKLGAGHETQYIYGTPSQDELDALFGTEVGDKSHYFKNAVLDANGQYSVSYVDMHGRTIATALAGAAAPGQDTLTTYITRQVREQLADTGSAIFRDRIIEHKKSLFVDKVDNYVFNYKLNPETLVKEGCVADSNICYSCLYDLRITVTDDCNNQKLPGHKAFDTVIHNFSIGAITPGCTSPGFTVNFTLPNLQPGNYEITKQLSISKYATDYYRDSVFMVRNRCSTLQTFINEQRNIVLSSSQCVTSCSACRDSLGSLDSFIAKFIRRAGIAREDSVANRGMAIAAYQEGLEACNTLCGAGSDDADIRKALLLDLTPPSGQYANINKTEQQYSIFYAPDDAPARYQAANIQYLDELGRPDTLIDDRTGERTIPGSLDMDQFSDKFNTSWANALLPLHPEYCKLLEYEKYSKSNTWDRKMEKTDTYKEARDSGYLNALAGTGSYFGRFPNVPGNADPLLTLNASLATQLKAKIASYTSANIKENGTPGNHTFSMWSMAAATIKLNGTDTVGIFQCYANPFDPSACTGDLDMEWRSFRELYLQAKRELISGVVNSAACSTGLNPSVQELTDAGYNPNFNNVNNAMGANGLGYATSGSSSIGVINDSATIKLNRLYDENCRSYVALWVQQLAPCKYDTNDLKNIIIPKLIAVCKEGADQEHQYGASTTRPTSTYQYHSFQEVLAEYNQLKGITDMYTCNPELITAPKAYDRPLSYSNVPVYQKPDSCQCMTILGLFNSYQKDKLGTSNFSAYVKLLRKADISDADLTALLGMCNGTAAASGCSYRENPIMLPPALQCGMQNICVTCVQTDSLYNRFTRTYPGIIPDLSDTSELQRKKNDFFANYMNNHLGFGKDVTDYLQFRDSCSRSTLFKSVCSSNGTVNSYRTNNTNKDYINDIIKTADGGYMMAGRTVFAGDTLSLGYLVKTNNAGNIEWASTYNESNSGIPNSSVEITRIRTTQDGGYILVGTVYPSSGYNPPLQDRANAAAFIAKLSVDGTKIWSKRLNPQTVAPLNGASFIAKDAVELGQGSNVAYLFAVYLNYFNSSSNSQLYLIKLNAQGQYTSGSNPGNTGIFGVSSPPNTRFSEKLYMSVGGGRVSVTASRVNSSTNLYHGFKLSLNASSSLVITDAEIGWVEFGLSGQNVIVEGAEHDEQSSAPTFMVPVSSSKAGETKQTKYLIKFEEDGVPIWANRIDPVIIGGGELKNSSLAVGNSGVATMLVNAQDEFGNSAYWCQLTADGKLLSSSHFRLAKDLTANRIIKNSTGLYSEIGVNNSLPLLALPTVSGKIGCNTDSAASTISDVISQFAFNPQIPNTIRGSFLIQDLSFDWEEDLTVQVTKSTNCCNSIYIGPLLCGTTTPVFSLNKIDDISNCSDSSFFIQSKATELYKVYSDSLKGGFENDYVKKCMNAYRYESFTVTHKSSEYHYTLYYYDQAGNLIKTVPPAGVNANRDSVWLSQVRLARKNNQPKAPIHTMITTYRYNTLNQVIEQKTPDAGTSKFWYDRLGRLAISQNAKQFKINQYSYTLYDYLGRITQVGQLTSATAMLDATCRNDASLQQWLTNAQGTKEQITTTVYDQSYVLYPYAKNLRSRVSYSAVYNTASDLASGANFATATFYSYDIHGNVDTLLQFYKQGPMANVGGNMAKRIVYQYDLISGKVNHVAYQPGKNNPDAFYHRYSYDAENRLTNVETSRDSTYWENEAWYTYYKHGPLARVVLGQQQVQGVDYVYTLQGWIKAVNPVQPLTGGSNGTGTNCTGTSAVDDLVINARPVNGPPVYTARNSITFTDGFDTNGEEIESNINSSLPLCNSTGPTQINTDGQVVTAPAADAFNYVLHYNNSDFKGINAPAPDVSAPAQLSADYKPLYNGNISGMGLNVGKLGNPFWYNYKYDQLNRLVQTDAWKSSNNAWTSIQKTGDYHENVSYDPNGNILTYNRSGFAANAKGLPMDSLIYSYISGRNQLSYITDKVTDATAYTTDIDNQSPGNYAYDSIGNLVKDQTAGITDVKWNVYGKIQSISKSGLQITYTYDAAGNRIMKSTSAGDTTCYIRDAQGNVLSVYNLGNAAVNSGHLSLIEIPVYGSSRLGNVNPNVDVSVSTSAAVVNMPRLGEGYSYGFTRGSKLFELSNHLGNVLATVSDRRIPFSSNGSTIDYYNADVVSAQDYYPFGMLQPGRSYNAGGYRYGFNGKENDNEVKGDGNQQDYGMRIYDPRVGRWYAVDPVVKPWLSPYQFGANSPTNNIDAGGNDEIHFHTYKTIQHKSDGTVIGGVTSNIKIIKSNGPDKFFHHTHCTEIKIPSGLSQGGMSTFETSTQFYPWSDDSRSGITDSKLMGMVSNKLWGGDRDYVTLIKYINENPQLQAFFEKKVEDHKWDYNDEDYKKILSDAPKYQVIKNIQDGAELVAAVMTIVDGSLAVISSGNKMWLSSSASFGADEATLKSFNNLVSKKGWFDVVVHGDANYPGVLFNIDGTPVNAEALLSMMKEAGYKEGMKIRLISCNAGKGGLGSAAQELSNLSKAQVISPAARTKVGDLGKLITEDDSKYKVFNPEE